MFVLYSAFSPFLNPADASETRQWICFPTGAHSVDPAAECIDADTSPESNQVNNNNNNNNPTPPPTIDHLARFLRLNPPVFSSSIEPIVADDWLHKIGRELTTAGCTDAERVCFAAHQLNGPAASWWENFIVTYPIDTVPWDQFQQAFRTTHYLQELWP